MTQVKTTLRSAYLAGPMRGIEDYNFPAFREATAWLRGLGWEVFSPAERDESDPEIDHEEDVAGWSGSRGLDYFMAYDLKAVCEMDAVILLPGWYDSQGARLEAVTAVEVGHPVFTIEGARGNRRLEHVDPAFVQRVFADRGLFTQERICGDCDCDCDQGAMDTPAEVIGQMEREHSLSADCWCGPEREDFSEAAHGDWDDPPYPAAFERAYERSPEDAPESALPTGSEARKGVPLARGVLDYFPAALAEVARVSKAGNDKHNPGQEMHHARGKSTDHADCLLRHLVDRGKVDPETGQRHSGEVAWRALALLQEELEDEGLAPLARGARLPEEEA